MNEKRKQMMNLKKWKSLSSEYRKFDKTNTKKEVKKNTKKVKIDKN